MALTPKQEKLLDARRIVFRAANSVEGEAVLAMLEQDVQAATRQLMNCSSMEELFRAQGAVQALEKFKKYFIESPIIDR